MSLSVREVWYPSKTEKGIVARFDLMEVYDVPASQEKGIEVFKKIPVILIKSNNSGDYVPQKVPVDPIARRKLTDRFPEAWASFQGEIVELPGSPLDGEFRGMRLGQQQYLKLQMAGVSSWEQIAEFSDASCQHLGFGTQKLRDDVMVAMGRTPPGKPLNITLSEHMNAEQALRLLPGGEALVASLTRQIAEKNSGDVPEAAPAPAVDMTSPAFQAAVQAAVAAILASQPAGTTVQAAADSSPASEETSMAPDAPAGKRGPGRPPKVREAA
jgi:hypothetical protein